MYVVQPVSSYAHTNNHRPICPSQQQLPTAMPSSKPSCKYSSAPFVSAGRMQKKPALDKGIKNSFRLGGIGSMITVSISTGVGTSYQGQANLPDNLLQRIAARLEHKDSNVQRAAVDALVSQ
jgi:hypothetical protein